MTKLTNDPHDFVAQALEGYAAAQPDRVMAVPNGGIVRASRSPAGQVAVVMGGGAGHFPAFAGWVGAGFGHGAVCGNIFSSPSEDQILAVAHASDNGGGMLFAPINYAGDMLHFGAAAAKLRAQGTDVRMRAITDDIVSAPSRDYLRRRGIAGAFIVLKIVGAAAERGDSLDEVERIMIKANSATRSFGVAFGGCTLPGASEPMFVIPPGRMAVGLGIHGEPGTGEVDRGSADQVGDLIIDGLFNERAPVAGGHVAVLVNGLGATKYDELSIIYRRVAERLAAVGLTPIAAVVGEQVTSLDMAGLSVSLTYLDQELEELWMAPADVASFSRGVVGKHERRSLAPVPRAVQHQVEPGSQASQMAAVELTLKIELVKQVLTAHEARLGAIDAVAGDGDHGTGMVLGSAAGAAAAQELLTRQAGAGTLLSGAARAWSKHAGGTSGALWGAGLEAAAAVLGDQDSPSSQMVAQAAGAFAEAIVRRGGAALGDKTMVDAVVPFAEGLAAGAAAGLGLTEAWRQAAQDAQLAAAATARFPSRRGRSRLHGERSVGTADPGATSFALIVSSVLESCPSGK
ncbi:MAG: dihydroxyacetone kinase family protein [Bifidobacteriaceae bacterium]|jgi:dihydroxyacetone kinase|nr:dihydroxyacetone kinase family protein [Bifidobacteriaceae bacterium]